MGPVSPWCCNQCPKRTNERTNGRRREQYRIGTKKKRARAHQQSKESAMAIAKSFQLQIKNHRNDNSFWFKENVPKGRQVDGIIRKRKRKKQRGGTKEDKSLRGTTTGTCDTSDQTKHKSKRTQGNVWSISKGGNEVCTRPPQEEETSDDERKKRKKNRKSNKNNHTTRSKQRE